MLRTALALDGPCIIRYPRGRGPGRAPDPAAGPLRPGEAAVLRAPRAGAPRTAWIWALGDMTGLAESTAARVEAGGTACGVVNARFVKPLDETLLQTHAREAAVLMTLENGVCAGGFGAAICERLAALGSGRPVLCAGWPDAFVPHGAVATLRAEHGLTPEALAARILDAVAARPA
jgi:1-deoxy-D-xylulose-5-phosphate synthase